VSTSVNKSTGMDVYRVRAGYKGYEWATICVQGWQATGNDGQPREIGEILIHSSYGSWAYQWGHLGLPFKQWLAKADDKDYIAGKFLGSKAYVFDGQKTVAELRHRVIEKRRNDVLNRDQARAIWNWIEEHADELECSGDRFCERMSEGPSDCELSGAGARFFQEPWEWICTSLDHQFEAFWHKIMPAFQQALRDELITDEVPA